MIYIQVDEEISGIHESSQTGRFITKDGNIVAQSYDESANKVGFRPGMMALRDIKKQWTLREFESLDSQFVYKIKKAESPVCKIVSLDQSSLDNFQLYMRNFNFQRVRSSALLCSSLDFSSLICPPCLPLEWGISTDASWRITPLRWSSCTSRRKTARPSASLSFRTTMLSVAPSPPLSLANPYRTRWRPSSRCWS
jgi:hypothetical protein